MSDELKKTLKEIKKLALKTAAAEKRRRQRPDHHTGKIVDELSNLLVKTEDVEQQRAARKKIQDFVNILSMIPQGEGSTLNADMVDGQNASEIITAAVKESTVSMKKLISEITFSGAGGGGAAPAPSVAVAGLKIGARFPLTAVLSGKEEIVELQDAKGQTLFYIPSVSETCTVPTPPDPLDAILCSLPLRAGYIAGTGELRSDIIRATEAFTFTTVNVSKFSKADLGALELDIDISLGIPTPVTDLMLKSKGERGSGKNEGWIKFNGVLFSLPKGVRCQFRTYDIEFFPAEGKTFVRWDPDGDVSIEDLDVTPTTVSVGINGGSVTARYE